MTQPCATITEARVLDGYRVALTRSWARLSGPTARTFARTSYTIGSRARPSRRRSRKPSYRDDRANQGLPPPLSLLFQSNSIRVQTINKKLLSALQAVR
jgi:hypothetical protein